MPVSSMELNDLVALMGAETGLVKRVKFSHPEPSAPVVAHSDNVNKVVPGDRETLQITSICPRDPDSYFVGRRDGAVHVFGKKPGVLLDDVEGTRLAKDPKDDSANLIKVCSFAGNCYAAFSSGRVAEVPEPLCTSTSFLIEAVTEKSRSKPTLNCARIDNKTGRIGLGGRKIDLQVWDLAGTDKPIFVAKKPGVKTLIDIPVTTVVNDVAFFPAGPEFLSASEDGKVRVYDPRVQRKPVRELAPEKDADLSPITAVKIAKGGQAVILGTSNGRLKTYDMRKTLVLASNFKEIVGSVRDFDVFQDEESGKGVIASVGLGRWLHLHDLDNAILLQKIYVKSSLNCVQLYRDTAS